jgi:hypothetical protein
MCRRRAWPVQSKIFRTGYAPDFEFDIAIQFRFAPSESVVDFSTRDYLFLWATANNDAYTSRPGTRYGADSILGPPFALLRPFLSRCPPALRGRASVRATNAFDSTAFEPAASERPPYGKARRSPLYPVFAGVPSCPYRLDFAAGGRDTGTPCLSIWRGYSNFEMVVGIRA